MAAGHDDGEDDDREKETDEVGRVGPSGRLACRVPSIDGTWLVRRAQ